jgi:hypothetical protein
MTTVYYNYLKWKKYINFLFEIIYYPKKHVNFSTFEISIENFFGTLVFMTFSFEIIYYPEKHVNFSTFEISSLKKLELNR